jgi:poly(A) polymerase
MKFITPRVKYIDKPFNVPSIILKLNAIFNHNGYKLYIVGGAIRDFLNKEKPKDYDLCTDAMPEKIIEILSPYYKVQLQGEAFGVVVVFTPDIPEGMEIATFRKDITKGRQPEVELGVTIEEDVQRRDLTINSLFYDLETKEIVDLVGGIEDLKNGIIRMVGDPMERIEEDPLRILRVFRFTTRYGSKIDDRTKQAIHKFNDISDVSMERIWDSQNGEFIKSFKQAKDFQQYLDLLTEFKLWSQILPGLKINSKIKNQDSLLLVMAQILINNDVKTIQKVLTKCAVPSILTNQIIFLINLLSFKKENILKTYKSKIRFSLNDEDIDKWLNINNVTDNDILKFTKFKPSVDSKKVMDEYDLKPSAELGQKINELEVENFENL